MDFHGINTARGAPFYMVLVSPDPMDQAYLILASVLTKFDDSWRGTVEVKQSTIVGNSLKINCYLVWLMRTWLLKSSKRDTMYPWTGLLIKSVLVGTPVCCFLIIEIEEEDQLYSFHARWRLSQSSSVSGKPLVIHLRYAFPTNTIPGSEPR